MSFDNSWKDQLYEDLVSTIPQEVILKEVRRNGGVVAKHTSAPSEVLDTELGSLTGGQFGLFYKPQPGQKAIAIRVHPGSTNHTQLIRVISNPAQQNHNSINEPLSDTEQGVMLDGNYEINPGDLLIRSQNNQALLLKTFNNGQNGEISLLDNNSSGIHIQTMDSSSMMTNISHYIQSASCGSKTFSGEYHKFSDNKETNVTSTSSNIHAVIRPDIDFINKIGLFFPGTALDSSVQRKPRNVPLSFYKKIVNQVSDKARFIGIENEKQILEFKENAEKAYSDIENNRFNETRKIYNLFFMSPDQLLQVISGNMLSSENNYSPININYTTTSFDDFKNVKDVFSIKGDKNNGFTRIKNNFKRGIGYHFQLNTHDDIMDDFSSIKNNRLIIDKEGIIKANIPKSSRYGNIMYVDDTYFMKGSDNYKPQIINGFSQPSSSEKIPITLRDKNGDIIFPNKNAIIDPTKRTTRVRYSGIEFSNSNGYFGRPQDSGSTLRVNTTKHHNMYATCEMLLANYIRTVSVPRIFGDKLTHIVLKGMSGEETFEKPSQALAGCVKTPPLKDYEVPAYGTVLVEPQQPVVNPGGSIIFGGRDYSNLPIYSNNDLERSEGDPAYSGVSASINLEGSLEASVGADDADGKSVTVDTEGGAVMWLGKDKNNRSLSMQTDGHVMLNIGGHSSDGSFNAGRLDLRVNLTDKGLLDDSEPIDKDTTDSDFIISISEKGIVISGMRKETPMLINNSGQIVIQSQNGILLNGGMGGVKVVEKNRPAKDVGLPQSSTANSSSGSNPTDAESLDNAFVEAAEDEAGSKC